jgi:hypothetical protein
MRSQWQSAIGGFALVFITSLVSSVAIAPGQGLNQNYGWLNGTWEGRPPLGGTMRMELQVVNGNQVKGSGFIDQPGRKRVNRPVEGTVDGDKVEISFFGGRDTAKFVLTFVDGALTGTGINSGQAAPVETTFRKLK